MRPRRVGLPIRSNSTIATYRTSGCGLHYSCRADYESFETEILRFPSFGINIIVAGGGASAKFDLLLL